MTFQDIMQLVHLKTIQQLKGMNTHTVAKTFFPQMQPDLTFDL